MTMDHTGLPHPKTIGAPAADDASDLIGEQNEGEQMDEAAWLREQLRQANETNQRMLDTFIQSARAPVAQPAPPPPAEPEMVSFDDLPDIVTDRAAFNREIAKKAAQVAERAVARDRAQTAQHSSQANTRANAVQTLWNTFQSEHAELAKRETMARGAYSLEAEALTARGIDPIQYAQTNPKAFAKSIADRMSAELGTAPAPAARTGGLGAPSRPGGARKPAEKKPISFIDAHRAQQRKMGLI